MPDGMTFTQEIGFIGVFVGVTLIITGGVYVVRKIVGRFHK